MNQKFKPCLVFMKKMKPDVSFFFGRVPNCGLTTVLVGAARSFILSGDNRKVIFVSDDTPNSIRSRLVDGQPWAEPDWYLSRPTSASIVDERVKYQSLYWTQPDRISPGIKAGLVVVDSIEVENDHQLADIRELYYRMSVRLDASIAVGVRLPREE